MLSKYKKNMKWRPLFRLQHCIVTIVCSKTAELALGSQRSLNASKGHSWGISCRLAWVLACVCRCTVRDVSTLRGQASFWTTTHTCLLACTVYIMCRYVSIHATTWMSSYMTFYVGWTWNIHGVSRIPTEYPWLLWIELCLALFISRASLSSGHSANTLWCVGYMCYLCTTVPVYV